MHRLWQVTFIIGMIVIRNVLVTHVGFGPVASLEISESGFPTNAALVIDHA
jgi:hypothetical protein